MTLIAAFRAGNGAIILADSQETVKVGDDEYRYSVLKIKPETVGVFEVVIGGGGNGEAIDSFIERFKRTLRSSRCKTLPRFVQIFETELRKTRKALHAQGDDTKMTFIVASRVGQKFEVWRTAADTLVVADMDKPTLVGFDSQLYQHIANILHSISLPIGQVIAVGLRVLELGRQTSTCIDRPYSGVVITRDKFLALDDDLLGELTESVTIFGAALDRLLLACADTHLTSKEFAEQLAEFQRTAIHLRADYLQTIGEMDFRKQMEGGLGYGIPLIPSGTLITGTIDPETGKIKIELEEKPEVVQAMVDRTIAAGKAAHEAEAKRSNPEKLEDQR